MQKQTKLTAIRENGALFNAGIGEITIVIKDALIMLAPLLALISAVMLTVDVVVHGGLATNTRFQFAWAIVQAVSIEGLLFATWFHIVKHLWNWKQIGYALPICTIMTMVDIAMFTIVMEQGLFNIGDSQIAMSHVGIPPLLFMYGRAVLAVLTPFLSIPFGYRQLVKPATVSVCMETYQVVQEDTGNLPLTNGHLPLANGKLPELLPLESGNSEHVESGNTVDGGNEHLPVVNGKLPKPLPGGTREKIRQALVTSPDASDRQIAKLAGVSHPTVGKYRKGKYD